MTRADEQRTHSATTADGGAVTAAASGTPGTAGALNNTGAPVEFVVQALRERVCEICGAREHGRWRLQAHHVDHNSPARARDPLVIIVCPRCHMRLHHWASTDWRWLLEPPPALKPRLAIWFARWAAPQLTPGQARERADVLLGILRERLAAVLAPLDWADLRARERAQANGKHNEQRSNATDGGKA